MEAKRVLGFKDLTLFNIAAVVGIRWLAAAAHAGPGSISLWVLAAVLFFVPSALAVSQLARLSPETGGIYVWTRQSFGPWHGFFCGWCYWLSNLFYFPQLILVGLGAALFAMGPGWKELLDHRAFMLWTSVALLWAVVLSHVVGLGVGRWTGNLGGLANYLIGAIIIVIGFTAWIHHGPQTRMDLWPTWNLDRLNFWSQIAFAFGGLELGAILGGEIRDPKRTIPRAAWASGALIALIYIAGTFAVLAVLKPEDVDPINGLAQVGAVSGARWIGITLGALIAGAAFGQLGAWAGGTARLPSVMGIDEQLPQSFAAIHPRWGTPYVSLLFLGFACTGFLVVTQLGESLKNAFQLLVDMCVISYFIPFVYLFLAAWKRARSWPALPGLAVTLLGIAFCFVPPDGASFSKYEAKLVGGTLALVISGWLVYSRSQKREAVPLMPTPA